MKTIFITGVSTGIGYGAAKEFSKRGYRVIGTRLEFTLLMETGPPLKFSLTFGVPSLQYYLEKTVVRLREPCSRFSFFGLPFGSCPSRTTKNMSFRISYL